MGFAKCSTHPTRFEGRGWRGFHHHATMCIAAYGFLVSERETIPPSAPRRAAPFKTTALPEGYRPRGSPLAAWAPHSKLDRNRARPVDKSARQKPAEMSLLRQQTRRIQITKIMTQYD